VPFPAWLVLGRRHIADLPADVDHAKGSGGHHGHASELKRRCLQDGAQLRPLVLRGDISVIALLGGLRNRSQTKCQRLQVPPDLARHPQTLSAP
jgi:hypothetical protein